MIRYNSVKIKLFNSQLNKLKLGTKNVTSKESNFNVFIKCDW